MLKILATLSFLAAVAASAAPKLQDSDFATSAQITGAGGTVSQLLNTSKIYNDVDAEVIDTSIARWNAKLSSPVNLTSQVTGILPLANGGTNANLTAVNGGICYSNGTQLQLSAAGSTGQVLQSAGAGTPTWSTPTYPSASGTAGQILRSNGTNNLYSTATFPNTAATSDLLYASATNVWSSLATANTSALVTSNAGVPSWASGTTANRLLRTDGTTVSFAQAVLTTDVSGTLPLGNGGTGQTSAAAAFGALSPLTTKGDILGFSTVNARVPVGTDGQVLTADSTQTLGIKWAAASAGTQMYGMDIINSGMSTSVAANALTINVLSAAGNTPDGTTNLVTVPFRNATAATGTVITRTVSAATSLVVPSGATLGMKSATAGYLYVYLVDTGAVAVPGISFSKFDDGSVISTTAIGAGSTSNNVIYTTSAQTSKPIRLWFRINISETTAGTWASNATELSSFDLGAPVQYPSFRAHSSTTTLTSGSTVDITWSTIDWDTANAYSGATYTCPIAGRYQVNSVMQINATYALGNQPHLIINQAGTAVADYSHIIEGALGTNPVDVIITDIVNCAKGDALKIQVKADGTSPSINSTVNYNWFAVQWIGL